MNHHFKGSALFIFIGNFEIHRRIFQMGEERFVTVNEYFNFL